MAVADVTQTTAASQPLLLAWSGVNYWWNGGVNANFCSTPDNVANEITGDIEIIVYASYPSSGPSVAFVGKYSSGLFPYCFVQEGGRLKLYLNNGAIIYTSNVNPLVSSEGWIKVTRNASNGKADFYTSTDSKTTNLNSITWTQLGTTINGTSGAISTNTDPLEVGSIVNGAAYNYVGKIYRVTLSDTIGGAPVVDFNPSEYSAASSQTDWNSSTREVWTINTGTASGGYKGQIVDRTYFQNDGIDDCLIAILSGSGIKTQYFTHKVLSALNGMPFGLYTDGAFAQAFYYPSSTSYGFYQSGPQDGPFGTNVSSVKKLRVSGAVGGTGTDWIPFQNGVDVSNGGFNVGSANSYTSIRISVRGNDTGYDNGIVGNYIVTNQADTSLQRTTIQNLLKTMSNL